MKRRESFLPTFLVVVFLCVVIMALSLSGSLNFLLSPLEKVASAIQGTTFGIFQKLPFVSENTKVKQLEETNLQLLSQVAAFEKLKKENAALSDQFQTSFPKSTQLLEAQVIGAAAFVPGVSVPDRLVINKGQTDNIKLGSAVVIKDNLAGVISQVSANISQVDLISNQSLSFTAKTQNGAIGVIKGGSSLTLNNILLSENVTAGELVLTKGNIGIDGTGAPADLVVGKVTSVEKNPSDLFQKAKVESFINFVNLSTVFVYMQIR